MNTKDCGNTAKKVSEFEKLINQLDASLAEQQGIIRSIEERVARLISVDTEANDIKLSEATIGGFVGEIQKRIQLIQSNNRKLDAIDIILNNTIG